MIDSIVLNIPHSSSEFPGTAKDGWENGIDEHIQRWTDWGTDRLFGMASSMDPRIHPVTFPWSRFFCDVERLENDPLEKNRSGHRLFIFRRNRAEHYRNRNHLQVILPWAQGCRHQGADAVFDTDRLPLVSFRPVRRGSMHRLQR